MDEASLGSAWERRWYSNAGWQAWDLLAPLSWAVAGGVRLRNGLFDAGVLPVKRLPAKVISVGNLNVGGSGKTRVVMHLAQQLVSSGRRVAVLSRGYGRVGTADVVVDMRRAQANTSTQELAALVRTIGDEPALICRRVPGVAVAVGPDRAAVGARAIAEVGCDTLLLDDGFQHRRVARDHDVLVLGGPSPLGNGRLLPAGPLREPVGSARRATLGWLIDPGDGQLPEAIPGKRVTSRTRVSDVLGSNGESMGVDALKGKRVMMLAGLARPTSFARTLSAMGAEIAGQCLFDDHRPYSPSDLHRISELARSCGAEWVVTTEKDGVRLPGGLDAGAPPLAIVAVDLEIVEGHEHLEALLG